MSPQQQGMACPIDGAQLVMSERQGIEIDYCPTCRGVWLDRGELDKILERSAAESPPPQQQPAPPAAHYPQQHHHNPYGYKKRRKSFLEELFD
jgi:Zn-finger nucleic acid-binding protein